MLLVEFIQALGVMTKLCVISRFTLPNKSRDRLVGIVIDHGLVNREIVCWISDKSRRFNLFSKASRPALKPTQSPLPLILRVPSLEAK